MWHLQGRLRRLEVTYCRSIIWKARYKSQHEQFLALNLKHSRNLQGRDPKTPTSANLNLTADDRGPQLKGLNWAKFETENFFSEGVDLQSSLKW